MQLSHLCQSNKQQGHQQRPQGSNKQYWTFPLAWNCLRRVGGLPDTRSVCASVSRCTPLSWESSVSSGGPERLGKGRNAGKKGNTDKEELIMERNRIRYQATCRVAACVWHCVTFPGRSIVRQLPVGEPAVQPGAIQLSGKLGCHSSPWLARRGSNTPLLPLFISQLAGEGVFWEKKKKKSQLLFLLKCARCFHK